jgi:GTP diphosphokinase / guanosine-3',5'-bis(diphosphate) 3'-diphosphatase
MDKADRQGPDVRSVAEQWHELRCEFAARRPGDGLDLIDRAYRTALAAHDGQWRKSGDPYIVHPLAAALEACRLGMDGPTVAAALCHDVIEDCNMSVESLAAATDPEVARIVDGVTKVDRIHFDAADEAHAATLRKMLVALAEDVRVLVVKLCDRLHNMRTLSALPDDKAARIASETLWVYAPLAHRLGLHEVKWQLEDLAFSALHPNRYAELERMLAEREGDRSARVDALIREVTDRLSVEGIEATVTGRAKHLYSVYSKMMVGSLSLDEIFDLVGLRVICSTELECYTVIGVVHRLWTPVAGRFRDYIAAPTYNLYESLHTTVVTPGNGTVEIQVRTPEMHQRAEYGVASHYLYKHDPDRHHPARNAGAATRRDWVVEAAAIEPGDPAGYLEALTAELTGDEVYALTPGGRVVALPAGACAVDFAYAVHTEVGHSAVGARVDGRLSSLTAPLRSGQTVEIVTRPGGAGPRREWLGDVVTHRARSKIRSWHNARKRETDLDVGTEKLWRSLRSQGISETDDTRQALATVARDLRYTDVDSLIAAIGSEKQAVRPVVARLRSLLGAAPIGVAGELIMPGRRIRTSAPSVSVGGLSDMLVTMARCCSPVPGDAIVGFTTKGRGISVHRGECRNVVRLVGERLVDVEWGDSGAGVAAVEIEALDRTSLLADVSAALAAQRVNIVACRTLTGRDAVAVLRFEFELADASHLDAIMNLLRSLDGVYDVRRVAD